MKLKMRKKSGGVSLDFMNPPQSAEVEEKPSDTSFEAIDTSATRLESILNSAVEISNACTDYEVGSACSDTMELQPDLSIIYQPKGSAAKRHCRLTHFALSQFGTKIGVPANYLEKCVVRNRPEIAQYNVNAWLENYNRPLFIREYRDNAGNDIIRGVLSNRYAVCDTPDIIDSLTHVIDPKEFKLKGYYLSFDRFHVRLAENTKMDVPGEDLFAGMSINSSDVGRNTLSVDFLVFKQVCTNGLVVRRAGTNLFRQKHIGITVPAFKKGVEEGFELFPKIAARVAQSIEKTRNSESPFDFNYTDDEQLADLVTAIRKQTDLSPERAKNVVEIMNSGKYENNRWGYINTLTEVAQKLTLEKRLALEENAGRLLVA